MFLLRIVVRNSLLLLVAEAWRGFVAISGDVVIAAETVFIISNRKR